MELDQLRALDGKKVKAKTFESLEYDRPPEDVEGVLTVRYVDTLDYYQCLVDGTPIDPETITRDNHE